MYTIGIDLGGTNIVSLLMDKGGKIILRDTRKTLADKGKETTLKQIENSAKAVIEKARRKGIKKKAIVGVGIGSPGPLSIKKGIVRFAPNLPGWRDVPLVDFLRERVKLPVFLENDANAACLGEWWKGAGKGKKHIVLLTLGTGIGGGIVINNEILHGAWDTGAEVGHMTIVVDGLPCGCGSRGCLEAYASATGVVKRTLMALEKVKKSSLLERVRGDKEKLTSRIVYEEAKRGDSLAKEIAEETGKYLGAGIASLVNILNPEVVILGGGMIQAGELLFEPTRRYASRYALKEAIEGVEIVPARLGQDAGAIGAACVVWKRTNNAG